MYYRLEGLSKAKEYYQKMLANCPNIKEKMPNRTIVIDALLDGYSSLQSVCNNLGQLTEAKEFAKKRLIMQEKYGENDLNGRKGLSISYFCFGVICGDIGNVDVADKYLEKCTEITSSLINEYPGDLSCLVLHSISLLYFSDLHCFYGNLRKAKKLTENSLQIRQYLIEKDDTNRAWKRELSRNFRLLATIALYLNRIDLAKEYL